MCEAVASHRHEHVDALEPDDIRKLSIGAIWKLIKAKGCKLIHLGAPRARSKALGASGPKGLKPNFYSFINRHIWLRQSAVRTPINRQNLKGEVCNFLHEIRNGVLSSSLRLLHFKYCSLTNKCTFY